MTPPPGTAPDARTALARAGLPWSRVASCTPVGGGTYNTVLRVVTTDGTRLVLKLPPPAHAPALSYERSLLTGEFTYFRQAAALRDIPVPAVVHHGPHGQGTSGAHLLMTERPGESWHTLSDTLTAAERPRLRRSLGRILARAHTVTGPGFGYPGESVGALSPRWRPAFTAMLEAVLVDAERYSVRLPVPAGRVRAALRAAASALDEVRTPALVHFDLWEGNVLLHGAPGTREVSGIVDAERMFWGDPLAELPSLDILGAAEDEPGLMAGYFGGRAAPLDDAARTRIRLYRTYLYLIMLVETVPRGASAENVAWLRTHVTPALERTVAALPS
ncbi:aminoglycoside phosphotransferase family protein [Streptomyces nanshensis]|uniref:Aminoglycoside phosphotransferase domain-containing protein n=1 Tax=Streptomyces nanshensis TaxID=518642 RepID=A0A1E7LBT7_9ACTN|nr:aminoglycoside phosphotransferase family protein [Streptomyces nanshensis]OEV13689.1 hypothetical protein AN218_02315 [Streptomyces nanshensis]